MDYDKFNQDHFTRTETASTQNFFFFFFNTEIQGQQNRHQKKAIYFVRER